MTTYAKQQRLGKPGVTFPRNAAEIATEARVYVPDPPCGACNGTGVVIFAQLARRGVVYCVDPQKPPRLTQREQLGSGSAPCLCAKGEKQNEKWHMPLSVRQRCHRCRLSQSEHDALASRIAWREGAEDGLASPVTATVAHAVPAKPPPPDQWAGIAEEDRF